MAGVKHATGDRVGLARLNEPCLENKHRYVKDRRATRRWRNTEGVRYAADDLPATAMRLALRRIRNRTAPTRARREGERPSAITGPEALRFIAGVGLHHYRLCLRAG